MNYLSEKRPKRMENRIKRKLVCTGWLLDISTSTKNAKKKVLSTSEEEFATERWLQMRKLACPPAAGSARDHFSDADYKTKVVCDDHGQTVSIKMSFLVKVTIPSEIFFPTYDHASTDYSATRKRQISEGRAMRRKRRAETRLVNWITVTIVTYRYDYNIVPP